jgi:GGDEF domain-containing protein
MDGRTIRLKVSMGTATFTRGCSAEALLERADKAMLVEKQRRTISAGMT